MRKTRFGFKRLIVLILDILALLAAFVFSFLLRFDFRPAPDAILVIRETLPYLTTYLIMFPFFSLYGGIFYFSSFDDLLNIAKAVCAGGVATALAILFVRQGQFPRSVLILHPMLTFLGVAGIRFGIRFIKSRLNMPRVYPDGYREVLLVGAGELGESLLRQMRKTHKPRYRVAGFIDDDPAKWGRRLHGRPIFGGRQALGQVLRKHRVDEIVIAIASKRGEIVRDVVETLRDWDSEERPQLKIAPSLEEMLCAPHAGVSLRQVRPVDLLNREVVRLDMAKISNSLETKTVLVTGAGGTIGSELCRQVAQYAPAKLVLLESHATSLFYIAAELREKVAETTEIVALLGDIRDQVLVDRVFKQYRPSLIFHAAAHKHVHQLEFNVQEGVGNNILGTYYMASAAHKYEAEAFLLVSTDKAVKPSSVMGATKRVAEFIIRDFASRQGKTRFAAVRFGNVLGSSGSVLEIFQKQIAKGGPITVTHPDVTRYFMTVEEAVQLILQAITMSQGGEIYVLKMGTPVRIMDMAKNLILLSGLKPGEDIEIRVTGLKQGEKLAEELFEDPGACDESSHPSIMILRPTGDPLGVEKNVIDFEILSRTASAETLIEKLRELIPTFVPAASHMNGASLNGKAYRPENKASTPH